MGAALKSYRSKSNVPDRGTCSRSARFTQSNKFSVKITFGRSSMQYYGTERQRDQ